MYFRQATGYPRVQVASTSVPEPIRKALNDVMDRGFDRAFAWFDETKMVHVGKEHAPLSTDSARTYYTLES